MIFWTSWRAWLIAVTVGSGLTVGFIVEYGATWWLVPAYLVAVVLALVLPRRAQGRQGWPKPF